MNAHNVLKVVRLTEKATQGLVGARSIHIRNLRQNATKGAVREAVEQTFKVSVTRVNIQNYSGKNKRGRSGRPEQ
jgi:large subunit ribosomal protein L23